MSNDKIHTPMTQLRPLLCLCAWLISAMASAEVPVRIARIVEQMPCPPARHDTIVACPQVDPERKIVYAYDRHGDLAHIGISIFAPEFKSFYNRYVCNCVERLFLELLLKNTEAARTSFLKENGVRLTYNGFRLGSTQFPALRQGLALISERNHIALEERTQDYVFHITNVADDEMQMTIPKDRELIFGTDKKEEDEEVDRRLQTTPRYTLTPYVPDASLLRRTSRPDVWRTVGRAFMIDSVRSDMYFTRSGAAIRPVFDDRYPCESMCNLLLGQVADPEVLLSMTHKMYGLSIPQFDIPLSNFIGQMRQEQPDLYACARLIDRGEAVSGVLLIHHPRYNYIHLMTLTVPVTDLFVPAPTIKAQLYTNVPQHNVKNLFQENNTVTTIKK